eukprot:2360742-Amphidinium_carterae.1
MNKMIKKVLGTAKNPSLSFKRKGRTRAPIATSQGALRYGCPKFFNDAAIHPQCPASQCTAACSF